MDLSYQNLTEIPGDLPSGLEKLVISYNQITKIENLPSGLEKLWIHNNQITKIENLPDGLKELYIPRNPLECNPRYSGDQLLKIYHNFRKAYYSRGYARRFMRMYKARKLSAVNEEIKHKPGLGIEWRRVSSFFENLQRN